MIKKLMFSSLTAFVGVFALNAHAIESSFVSKTTKTDIQTITTSNSGVTSTPLAEEKFVGILTIDGLRTLADENAFFLAPTVSCVFSADTGLGTFEEIYSESFDLMIDGGTNEFTIGRAKTGKISLSYSIEDDELKAKCIYKAEQSGRAHQLQMVVEQNVSGSLEYSTEYNATLVSEAAVQIVEEDDNLPPVLIVPETINVIDDIDGSFVPVIGFTAPITVTDPDGTIADVSVEILSYTIPQIESGPASSLEPVGAVLNGEEIYFVDILSQTLTQVPFVDACGFQRSGFDTDICWIFELEVTAVDDDGASTSQTVTVNYQLPPGSGKDPTGGPVD